MATLPANDDKLTRKIGFISHMDTADFNAEGVSPQVIDSYDGGIIPLGNSGYNLDPADFPNPQELCRSDTYYDRWDHPSWS